MIKLARKIAIISFLVAIFMTVSVFGTINEDYNVKVRIRSPRLFNQQLSLDGYENLTVYKKNDNLEKLFEIDCNDLSILADSYYDKNYNFLTGEEAGSAVYGPYHVAVKDSFSSFDEAGDKVESLEDSFDEDFYPFYDGTKYKIYAGNFPDKKSAENFVVKLNANNIEWDIIYGDMKNVTVYDNINNIVFMYAYEQDLYFSSFNKTESCNMIKVDGRPYRGLMTFKIIDYSKLISINYVDLESYLYGVVPNEIPASWGLESLKSQAVAARTYAVYNINPYASLGYDLEDNQNSQVYLGYAYEKTSTTEAVNKTSGEMIYYNDKLIQAFYHSTSGGKTENSENVWSTALPYAVGVDDKYSDDSGSPYNEWQKIYAKDEIIKKLKDDGNVVNELYGIEIKQISENNRVTECVFLTDIGELSYKKENARLLLGLMSSWFTLENGSNFYFTKEDSKVEKLEEIPSRNSILGNVVDETSEQTNSVASNIESGSILGKYAISSSGTKKVSQEKLAFISTTGVSIIDTNSDQYNFDGRGWGHGIGMSQYGAKEMSDEGFTYDEILKHYYTGVTIK
ncbi:MAG: SpoIID/LytB domain-containing protein [Sedimentibacter sp.]